LNPNELAERAKALEWLLFDVDGVFTDGRLVYGSGGEAWKVFDVRDGLALKLAHDAGLKVGLLSGRENAALAVRAAEMGVDVLITERPDKGLAFAQFLAQQRTQGNRVAYMGDDLLDLPVLRRCALSFAPADSASDVRARVDLVLTSGGGRAAVREMVEIILKARGDWERVLAPYLGD
jgi:3-deoxy-D-manno-octulosonate 8-phosphate phosphatase (KDO 8-P phosphatase)